MAGGFGNRPSAKFGHVQPVLCARCDWRVCFSGRVSQREDFCFLREKRHFPQKMPIASASVNRAVHQRTECEKKHNRAPNRVPIRQILAARRDWLPTYCLSSHGGSGCRWSPQCATFARSGRRLRATMSGTFYGCDLLCPPLPAWNQDNCCPQRRSQS